MVRLLLLLLLLLLLELMLELAPVPVPVPVVVVTRAPAQTPTAAPDCVLALCFGVCHAAPTRMQLPTSLLRFGVASTCEGCRRWPGALLMTMCPHQRQRWRRRLRW
jgi:hypothetical protein